MKRSTRVRMFLFVILLITLGVSLLGCDTQENTSSTSDDPKSVSSPGTVALPLTGVSDTGVVYRLIDGVFEVSNEEGTVVRTVNSNDYLGQEVAEVDFPEGTYHVELLSGWRIERQEDDDSFTVMEAALVSSNPVSVYVVTERTISVVFYFRVGDEIIPIGDGTMAISIDVQELDTPPPPGCDGIIDIPDANLELAIREEIGLLEGDIYYVHMSAPWRLWTDQPVADCQSHVPRDTADEKKPNRRYHSDSKSDRAGIRPSRRKRHHRPHAAGGQFRDQ